MRTVYLTATEDENFFIGSDDACYTPVVGVEARCRWCRRWGHHVGLYHREVLFQGRTALVCARHIRRDDLQES
jgi:hypothetical protein